MPEVVETYLGQCRLLEEWFEGCYGDVAEVQRFARRGTKNKVAILPQISELEPFGVLSCLVGSECLYCPRMGLKLRDLNVLLKENLYSWAERRRPPGRFRAFLEYTPRLFEVGNTDFQFTRSLLGVSM
jgi:hypothetical protein